MSELREFEKQVVLALLVREGTPRLASSVMSRTKEIVKAFEQEFGPLDDGLTVQSDYF